MPVYHGERGPGLRGTDPGAPNQAVTAGVTDDPAATGGDPRRRVAVVDIGSNSIRLVVYDTLSRAPMPILNEKVMCGLGRGLGRSGRLNPAATPVALANLARFKALLDALQVGHYRALATAAVREADDGPDFLAEITRTTGLEVQAISGDEEARLGAMGVLSGIARSLYFCFPSAARNTLCEGATLNGASIRVSAKRSLSESVCATSLQRGAGMALVESISLAARSTRALGSSAIALSWVAAGRKRMWRAQSRPAQPPLEACLAGRCGLRPDRDVRWRCDPSLQSLVAGNPDRFHRAERMRRQEAGFPVGWAVFRVTGTAELADRWARNFDHVDRYVMPLKSSV